MAIGERIRFIRNLRGMTQKYLGTLVGFPEKTADIRMAQYESGTRTPKEDLTKKLAAALDVSPLALNVPDIDSHFGIMHTLFALEDRYGLIIEIRDGEMLFRIDPRRSKEAADLSDTQRGCKRHQDMRAEALGKRNVRFRAPQDFLKVSHHIQMADVPHRPGL